MCRNLNKRLETLERRLRRSDDSSFTLEELRRSIW